MSDPNDGNRNPDDGVARDGNLAQGLIAAHDAIGGNMASVQQLSAHVYALTETLLNGGVISLHVLDERKQAINQKMMAELPEKWVGARMLADEGDKYDAEREVLIDCKTRVQHCKAACCKLGFYLSRQDLEEGVVRWDFRRPYHVAQTDDGYCVHCTNGTRECNIWKNRPVVCRGYDCRNDKRIWLDFDKMVPNPELEKL